MPALLAPELLLSPFFPGRPETIAAAATPLRIVGGFMAADAVGLVLMQALLGAGAARWVASWATGLQWLLFLPAAYIVGPVAGGGLTAIWAAQAVQRVLQALIMSRAWRARLWTSINV